MKLAIIGAGSWGTALSGLWAKRGHDITLWGHNPERAEKLRETRENAAYLPGVRLPDSVRVIHQLSDCGESDLVVFVTPSTALREIAGQLHEAGVPERAVLLSCTKGIEHGTGSRMSQILQEIFPQHRVAVMSGPNLAVEVSREAPTATVLGCREIGCAEELQQQLGSSRFRIYSSTEVPAIELGGGLKNVFAVPAGACDGIGLGDNSKAALVTRSLAELVRLGAAMGGDLRTFYGLSGAGDLIATCFSKYSRNRRVGEELGRGRSLKEICAQTHQVAEGVPTTASAYECARKIGIETPIIDQVYAVLYQDRSPGDAMKELLGREQKAERF